MNSSLCCLLALLGFASLAHAQGSVSFTYDSSGQRIEKVTGSTRTSLFMGGSYEIVSTSGQTSTTKYIHGPGGLVASITSGQTRYLHSDHLGSISVITDARGTETGRILYTPYGETIRSHSTGHGQSRHTYTGQEEDSETGLQYYGARYRDPFTTLWLSADTLVPREDPLGYNRFSYVRGNPLRYLDPTGHEEKPSLWQDYKEGQQTMRAGIKSAAQATGDWVQDKTGSASLAGLLATDIEFAGSLLLGPSSIPLIPGALVDSVLGFPSIVGDLRSDNPYVVGAAAGRLSGTIGLWAGTYALVLGVGDAAIPRVSDYSPIIATTEANGVPWYAVRTSGGGELWVSTRTVMTGDRLPISTRQPLVVMSGRHGGPLGETLGDPGLVALDAVSYGRTVHNTAGWGANSPILRAAVNTPGQTIAHWCWSERSAFIINAMGRSSFSGGSWGSRIGAASLPPAVAAGAASQR